MRATHAGPLIVIWDNGPAHGGDAIREYLTTPGLAVRLVRLPADRPDVTADETIWGWVREEVTATTCFGTAAKVREAVGAFVAGLTERADAVRRRGRTTLQVEAEALLACVTEMLHETMHADPVCALV